MTTKLFEVDNVGFFMTSEKGEIKFNESYALCDEKMKGEFTLLFKIKRDKNIFNVEMPEEGVETIPWISLRNYRTFNNSKVRCLKNCLLINQLSRTINYQQETQLNSVV
jgi:hypothetical protein